MVVFERESERKLWRRTLEDLMPEFGLGFEEFGEFFNGIHCGWAEVVFHALDIVVSGFVRDAEELKEIGEEVVFASDVLCEFLAGGSENEAAVLFVMEEALGIEALDHVGDAGLRDAEASRDIDDSCVPFGANEFEDLLEIILCGGRSGALGRPRGHGENVGLGGGGVKAPEVFKNKISLH